MGGKMVQQSLHVVDYAAFVLILLVYLIIGLYHGCTGRKQRTTGEFLMANGALGVIPSAVSISVTFLSAITILGNAAEIYFFGITYWFHVFGMSAAALVVAYAFVPLYHPLRLTSLNRVRL